jgi:hypothetical protein
MNVFTKFSMYDEHKYYHPNKLTGNIILLKALIDAIIKDNKIVVYNSNNIVEHIENVYITTDNKNTYIGVNINGMINYIQIFNYEKLIDYNSIVFGIDVSFTIYSKLWFNARKNTNNKYTLNISINGDILTLSK